MRCTRCGRVVTYASPPQVDKQGRAFWPTEKPTRLDARYSTGYCAYEERMVQTIQAETPEEAITRVVKHRRKDAEPDDMWPEDTNFGVRFRG